MYHSSIPGRRQLDLPDGYCAVMAEELVLAIRAATSVELADELSAAGGRLRVTLRHFARAYALHGYDRTSVAAVAAMCTRAASTDGATRRRLRLQLVLARWAAAEHDALHN